MASLFEITTPRLRLYAPSLLEVHLLIRGERQELERRIQALIPPEWPGPQLTSSLPIIAEAMGQEPGDARWGLAGGRAAQRAGDRDIGYHSPLHDETTVEIGYTLLSPAQGFGYATEATSALIDWTFAHTSVAQIIAQIDPDNTASLRVAAKLGMLPLPPVSSKYLCFGITRPPA